MLLFYHSNHKTLCFVRGPKFRNLLSVNCNVFKENKNTPNLVIDNALFSKPSDAFPALEKQHMKESQSELSLMIHQQ
jgi:hypothetical protein